MTYFLNDYQQLMLNFSKTSPYNAVHFAKITTSINILDLEQSITKILLNLKLGQPKFSNASKTVSFNHNNQPVTLKKQNCDIVEHAQKQLNKPFAKNSLPVRFYLINNSNGTYLSLTYNHWVADAYSIFMLISLVINYNDKNHQQSLQLHASHKNQEFNFNYGIKYWYLFISLAKSLYTFSSAYRPNQKKLNASCLYTTMHSFSKLHLNSLKKLSKDQQVTVNDIFIAALARSFTKQASLKNNKVKRKLLKPKRQNIIISVITNIRPLSPNNLNNIFNVFLGYFNLSFNSLDNISNSLLLKKVNKKTIKAKQSKQALKNTLLFKIQSWYYKRSKNKYRLFHKNTPITVGLSNMNLRKKENSIQEGEYIRFSPSGAICPVVFNFTTYNDFLTLTITSTDHRFSKNELDEFKDSFIQELNFFMIDTNNL